MQVNEIALFEVNWDIDRRKEGQISFPTSSIDDPHIKKAIQEVANQTKSSPKDVTAAVQKKLDELNGMATDSPILYETINKNAAEQAIFEIFWKADIKPKGAPEFDNIVFKRLINQLRVDYDEFFPLRSYIDKRKLITPVIRLLEEGDKRAEEIPTAAATPSGEFLFNKKFMQSLMNYSFLKGVKPGGNKFKNNGGKFPDEYAWIEFIIMHEFMHYSNDDFYYQRIIPNANPTIINWVGDFRTNYQLVKSGFEALPIGLFNDKINYDRQREYVEMYDLVKGEFDRLKPEDQKLMEQILKEMADDHEPGNKEGQSADMGDEDVDVEDLDDNAKENGDAVDDGEEEGKDKDDEKGDEKGDEENPFADIRGQQKGKPGTGRGIPRELDYSKLNPQFNWKTIVARFIKSGMSHTEPTYSRPHRRSITTVDVARQTGAGAIKPAEKPLDFNDAKLMFIIDASGSMSWVIGDVMATAEKLLKQPAFRKSVILVSKFSGGSTLWKVNVAGNKAGVVNDPKEMPKNWDLTSKQVMQNFEGGGTIFSNADRQQGVEAIRLGYNVVIFSDSDIMYGDNKDNLLKLIKAGPKQVFVIFDTKSTWVSFRQQTGINTPNITFFKEDR